jgi:hypothetical protein
VIDVRSLSVKVGDLVIPAWRRLVSALETLQVLPGTGVLISRTPRGSVVNARAFLAGFSGSWSIAAPSADGLRVGAGYVNGDLVPGTGKGADPVPWSAKTYDDAGQSWLVLEVPVTSTGLHIPEKMRVLQADHPFRSGDKLVGRTPLGVFYRGEAGAGFGQAHRIAFFDLQHRYNPGTGRHFFFV